jgi:hypothetical protein
MAAVGKKVMRGAHAVPSPNDWADWQRRVEDGEDPKSAANARGLTLSNYRRHDFERQREILDMAREARADEADKRLEKWVSVDGASDQLKTYWHRYHANRAGRIQEQIRLDGQLGVSSDVAEALDRFTEMVAAAAVRQSGGERAGQVDGEPGAEGQGRARLQVAGLAGETGSGAA